MWALTDGLLGAVRCGRGPGSWWGCRWCMTLPSVSLSLYTTLGAVVIKVQIVLPLQPLLDDLHVQQPQEAAPEAKAQGHGGLRLKGEGGVVELQLFQSVPQIGVVGAVGGVDAAEHHGLHRPVARQRLGGGAVR